MIFGNNYLTIEHRPSGVKYSFVAQKALQDVKRGQLVEGDGVVKVGYADKWLQSRTDPSSLTPLPKTVLTKLYDWTYTTTYPGHFDQNDSDPASTSPLWKPADPDNPSNMIPLAELSRQDPILFYAEVPLFEDELHDNGASSLIVRIRVMPTSLFILLRFTLRVDNVLFRTQDTRLYHSFASNPPLMVRDISGWEAPYEHVQRHLPRRDDMTPLTDPNFIAKILSDLPKHISQRKGAETGWRGLGSKTEVAVLS